MEPGFTRDNRVGFAMSAVMSVILNTGHGRFAAMTRDLLLGIWSRLRNRPAPPEPLRSPRVRRTNA